MLTPLRRLAHVLLVSALALAGLASVAVSRAEAVEYQFQTPIAGDTVPVTVTLTDAPAGGVQVTVSIPAGSGDLLGLFGNVADESLLSGMGIDDPSGIVTQWQFQANQVSKVGAGNAMDPVKSWDWGVKLGQTGSPGGVVVESASFRLTGAGLTVAEIAGASTQGYVLGVRIQSTTGSTGSAKIGLSDQAPRIQITSPSSGALLGATPAAVSGTLLGTNVVVSVNGAAGTVSGSTFAATVPLTEGANTVTATGTNDYGTATDSVAVTLDTTPPTVTISTPSDGTLTAQSQVTVSGTVTDASPISQVTLAGQAVSLDSTGTYSGTVALALGDNPIEVTATDAAGNVGTASITVTRGAPPTVSLSAPVDGSLLPASAISVTGAATGIPAPTVTVNGTVATLSGQDFTAALTLAEGANTITATASNALGQAQASVSVTVDTIPPKVTITSPADGTLTTDSQITVTGTVTDASSIASFTVNGQAAALQNGSFSVDLPLTEGATAIVAQAVDAAGHPGSATVSVTRGDAPTLAITSPAAGLLTNQSPTTVTGTVGGTAPVSVVVNGVAASVSGGSFTVQVPLTEGSNTLSATATNAFGTASGQVGVTLDTTPPVVTITSPADGAGLTSSPTTVSGTVQDASPIADLSVQGTAVPPGSTFSAAVPLSDGANTLTVSATDAAGNVGTASVSVSFQSTATPLAIQITSPHDGSATVLSTVGVAGTVNGPVDAVEVNAVAATVSGPSFTATIPVSAGSNLVTATATRGSETATAQVTVVMNASPPPAPPPDPATLAPPTDRTVTTDFLDSVSFLYAGATPIQTGADPAAFDAKTIAVVRGRVLTRAGDPFPGVTVTIPQHPEYGSTVTRVDGKFDLAVSGGSDLALQYDYPGFLSAQRVVHPAWRSFAFAPDVILIPFDPKVTVVDLANSTSMQVARGSEVTDQDGTRQATVLFPAGTTATAMLPGGGSSPLPTLSIRATEATVGASGPLAMPAPLPQASGYTYAVDITADEAMALHATGISFNQPVVLYTDNFLGFSVGTLVPTGTYDFQKSAWVPEPNGNVIKILSVTGGEADLDTNGDGAADDATTLASLGITDAERASLAQLYSPGQTLWRTTTTHFSWFDLNWLAFIPGDSVHPSPTQATTPQAKHPSCSQGSIIECENQVLRERIPLVGVPADLDYSSGTVDGRKAEGALDIDLIGATVPSALKRIELTIEIAGQQYKQTFPAAPNQTAHYVWDGRDAYGRPLQGSTPARIRIGYVYAASSVQTPTSNVDYWLFGNPYTGIPIPNMSRSEVTLDHVWTEWVQHWDTLPEGLGGWTLSNHHAFDVADGVLFRGDGTRRFADAYVSQLIAGTGATGFSGDGGPAVDATFSGSSLDALSGITVGPDGTIYVGDGYALRKIAPDGIITTLVGDGSHNSQAYIGRRYAYLAMAGSNIITTADCCFTDSALSKVTPTGVETEIGTYDTINRYAKGLAVGPDGNIYAFFSPYFIPAGLPNVVVQISPDETATVIAGGGSNTPGDGLLATDVALQQQDYSVSLQSPSTAIPPVIFPLAMGPDGALYIGEAARIRRLRPDGTIETVAGTGVVGTSGDGGPAIDAKLDVRALAIGPDGTIYIGDAIGIRAIGPDGTINHIEHTSAPVYGLTVAPDGTVYYTSNHQVFALRKVFPQGIPSGNFRVGSADGSKYYVFSAKGRHLETHDARTGALLETFGYDSAGRLASEVDADGNTTTIERDSAGEPTAIVGPYGARTLLSVDANGYLSSVTDPAGETTGIVEDAEGLLQVFQRPGDPVGSTFQYDAAGRLLQDTNALGGFTALARTRNGPGDVTVTTATAGGVVEAKHSRFGSDGSEVRTITDGAGLVTTLSTDAVGKTIRVLPSGQSTESDPAPDPRFGLQSPIQGSVTVTTPAGLTLQRTQTRTATVDATTGALQTQDDTITLNGRISTVSFDGGTDTVLTTTAAGRSILETLDARGRLIARQIGSLFPLNLSYDAHGRLATLSQGSGSQQRDVDFGYDAAGNLASVTDPLLRSVSFQYDLAGRVTRETLPDGRFSDFTYDARGNMTSLTPPGQPAHVFQYTLANQESTYVPPSVVGVSDPRTIYTYDQDKNLVRVTRPDGKNVALEYDLTGRLSTVTIPRGTITQSYDPPTGNPSAITAPGGEDLAFTYDGSLPTSTTWMGPVAGSVALTYDTDFRVASQSADGGSPETFGYDPDGLLVQAGPEVLSRDPQTGLLTATSVGSVGTTQAFNGFGELTSDAAQAGASTAYANTYSRDALGRITHKVETIQGTTTTYDYHYDLAGRLTQVDENGAVARTYSYDANGNRLSATSGPTTVSGTYDAQDRLHTYGSNSYTYSAAGDLETKTDLQTTATTQYHYDALGDLTSVTLPDGRTISYVIDGQNRRVGKAINGIPVQGFLYKDQLNPVAELDGSGNVTAEFVYGTRPNVPDLMIKGGTTYQLLTDQVGSVRLVVNTSSGAVAQRIDYDEFGRITQDTNPGFQPFGFAGGLYDTDTGLIRFGARDYDPEVGRWTAVDPIRFRGGDPNLYGYSLNDPVNLMDPNGEISALGLSGTILGAVSLIALTGGTAAVPIAIAGIVVGGGALIYDTSSAIDEGIAQGHRAKHAICQGQQQGPEGRQLQQVLKEP